MRATQHLVRIALALAAGSDAAAHSHGRRTLDEEQDAIGLKQIAHCQRRQPAAHCLHIVLTECT